MTAWKTTLLAIQWLLLSTQGAPEPYYKARPLTPKYVEYLRSISILPPPEFDREYDGMLTVVRGTQQQLREACPNSFKPSNLAIGCAKPMFGGGTCIVFILNDAGLQMIGWDYEIVFRHERAHCVGWHHD